MIQNTQTVRTRVATYVYLRNGIYYFQLRLKKNDVRGAHYKSGLIRKSLKTGNYREAIQRARMLWFEYMTDKKTLSETQDEIDASAHKKADLFSRGKELYDCHVELNPDDINAQDWFFAEKIGEFGKTAYDQEALQYYREYVESKVTVDTTQDRNQSLSVPQSNKPRVRISEMVERFINENQSSAKPWKKSQLGKYKVELQYFCERMNDCYLDELLSENIRTQYVDTLHLLPLHAKQQKVLHDKKGELVPFDQMIQLTKKHKLTTLEIRTYKAKAILVKSFLKSLANDEYVDDNLVKAFTKLNKIVTPKKQRPVFTIEDLQLMFNNDEFFKGVWFKQYTFRHWGLLIALYTGARINEICQLDVDDIVKDKATGIDYINFVDEPEENKSTKTDNSYRQVPVHRTLIQLGFLNYVESQKRKKEKKLFSEVTLTGDGIWCRKLKDWFNHTYLEEIGIDKFVSKKHTSRSFHCFRSTVINFGKQNGLDRSVMEEVIGHENTLGSSVHDSYADLHNLTNRQREINKIKYDIDIDRIKKWK